MVTVGGIEQTIHAALATFSADSLSAHMLAGFTMSFNSARVCRYCMATHTEIKEKFRESDFVLRTPEVHQYHLMCIENTEDQRMYGVNYPSPFNELNYFDVTQAFPPDIMHDLLEGVIPLIIKLVLSWAHKEKHITIQELNDELQQLSIGQNDKKNKPVQLSERTLHKSGIAGPASQKCFLFKILPFLMAHRVPPNSKHWNVFLLCCDIVIAPRLSNLK